MESTNYEGDNVLIFTNFQVSLDLLYGTSKIPILFSLKMFRVCSGKIF